MSPERFHVTITFQKDGPTIEGTWSGVALRKFQAFVRSHGDVGVGIILWAETRGERERLRTFTQEGGLMIHREM